MKWEKLGWNAGLYFLVLVAVFLSLDSLVRPLDIQGDLDATQLTAIRMASFFSYRYKSDQFLKAVLIECAWLTFQGIFLGIIFRSKKSTAPRLYKLVFFVVLLSNYFFWVFSSKYANQFWLSIRSAYHKQFLIHIGLFAASYATYWLINLFILSSHKGGISSKQEVPTISVSCPTCNRNYRSNVKYCIQCKEKLEKLE